MFPIDIIRKRPNTWVFGCMSGKSYADNSKYLFEYVNDREHESAVWLSNNPEALLTIRNGGRKALPINSLRGIYYALTAKYIVISYSYDDVGLWPYLFPKNNTIINLYHGTPLKILRKAKESHFTKTTRYIMHKHIARKYDLVISASHVATEKLNMFFNIPLDNFAVTGLPRNDALYNMAKSPSVEKIKSMSGADKAVLYMPTFREYSFDDPGFNLFQKFGFEEIEVSKVLERNNAVLIIKLHFRDYERIADMSNAFKSKRIHFLRNEDINDDIYPLLNNIDMLITDYSSIYFDYLLLNRPIIFSNFDIQEYMNIDRGFYFEYDEITPGDKAHDWPELLEKINRNFEDTDRYSKERGKVSKRVNAYHDASNSRRAYDAIKAL